MPLYSVSANILTVFIIIFLPFIGFLQCTPLVLAVSNSLGLVFLGVLCFSFSCPIYTKPSLPCLVVPPVPSQLGQFSLLRPDLLLFSFLSPFIYPRLSFFHLIPPCAPRLLFSPCLLLLDLSSLVYVSSPQSPLFSLFSPFTFPRLSSFHLIPPSSLLFCACLLLVLSSSFAYFTCPNLLVSIFSSLLFPSSSCCIPSLSSLPVLLFSSSFLVFSFLTHLSLSSFPRPNIFASYSLFSILSAYAFIPPVLFLAVLL